MPYVSSVYLPLLDKYYYMKLRYSHRSRYEPLLAWEISLENVF